MAGFLMDRMERGGLCELRLLGRSDLGKLMSRPNLDEGSCSRTSCRLVQADGGGAGHK